MEIIIKFCLLYFLFSTSFEQTNLSNFYILPLTIEGHPYTTKKTEKTNEEIIASLLNIKHKTTNLYTGTPKLLMSFELSFDSFSLYMSSDKVSNNQTEIKKYCPSNSSTYEEYRKEQSISNYQKCSLCVFAKEKFSILENNNIKEFSDIYFVMGNELQKTYNNVSASIGLNAKQTSTDIIGDNLIMQLKQKKYLNEYCFRIRYSEEKNKNIFNYGELIIGSYPHQYLPKVYNENNFKYFYIGSNNSNIEDWEFTPKKIAFGSKNLNVPFRILFNIDSIFIKASVGLYEIVQSEFFNDLVTNGKCKTFRHESSFIFYICNEDIDITKMGDLIFYPDNTLDNINITFTPNDLFYKFKDNEGNNKLLYLVCFNSLYSSWEIGNIFIKKYQPVFDFDKKLIGFYDTIYSNKEDEYKKESYEKDKDDSIGRGILITVLIIVVVIVSVLLIGIAVFFYLYVKKNKFRTKRANELHDDDYTYEPDKNINEGNDKDNKLLND